jgi:Big-like domain-containing protein/N,N-dimethylformamidase beta subunit-like protein
LQAPGSNTRAQAVTPVTHHMTLYRAASGALVFSSGTIQWSWGLDATHDGPVTPTDTRMRQATVNLLADMGVQPATLQSGLVAATASTDATPPTSVVSPVGPAQVNQPVIVSGTAVDVGGAVGSVEVSTDGGQTWNPANGRGQWSFAWTPTQAGTYTIRSRAADDSANLEQPGPGIVAVVV